MEGWQYFKTAIQGQQEKTHFDWSALPTDHSPPQFSHSALLFSILSGCLISFLPICATRLTGWPGHILEVIQAPLSYCPMLAECSPLIHCAARPATDYPQSPAFTPCQRSNRQAYCLFHLHLCPHNAWRKKCRNTSFSNLRRSVAIYRGHLQRRRHSHTDQ